MVDEMRDLGWSEFRLKLTCSRTIPSWVIPQLSNNSCKPTIDTLLYVCMHVACRLLAELQLLIIFSTTYKTKRGNDCTVNDVFTSSHIKDIFV